MLVGGDCGEVPDGDDDSCGGFGSRWRGHGAAQGSGREDDGAGGLVSFAGTNYERTYDPRYYYYMANK